MKNININAVFQTGIEAPEVVAKILEINPKISTVYFYAYQPTYNVKESMRGRKGRPLMDSLLYHGLSAEHYKLKKGEVTAENINRIINSLKEDVVLGVLSKVRAGRNRTHIPMMDFDERKCEGRWDIVESFLRGIGQEGVVLHSGRAYHFYGVHLLQERDWLNFLGKCILSDLVDDRYIGHRLLDGCGLLRISACPLRPKVPTVISTVTKKMPITRALMVIKQ